jgi:hypothetical protein
MVRHSSIRCSKQSNKRGLNHQAGRPVGGPPFLSAYASNVDLHF